MANVDLSVQSALISGTAAVVGTCQTAAGTITFAASAGSFLDLSKVLIRIDNACTVTGATVLCTIEAGTVYSDIGLGDYTFTVGGTTATVYIGGKDLESARFLQGSDQTVMLTYSFASTALSDLTTLTEIVRLPGGFTA
jgi:hypothetical protein